MNNILEIKNLDVNYYIKNKLFGKPDIVSAVNNVSLSIERGEAYGLVGESGCGKTTLASAVLGMLKPEKGEVFFKGKSVTNANKKQLYEIRKDMQMIFQDPFSSLNPRLEVWELIGEPMIIRGEKDTAKVKDRALALLKTVGLSEMDLNRHAGDFSGGQRQRIVIARALCLSPEFIVCDEPVSALDVSVHAQIINLLADLQESLGLTYLFISHNLALIKHFTQKVAVMYLGNIMEEGETSKIFSNPVHPYTKALMSAILDIDNAGREKIILRGDVASPINPPSGCRFCSRCPIASERCVAERPALTERESGHFAACFNA